MVMTMKKRPESLTAFPEALSLDRGTLQDDETYLVERDDSTTQKYELGDGGMLVRVDIMYQQVTVLLTLLIIKDAIHFRALVIFFVILI